MHELYIAECILKSAGEALPVELSPESVRQIRIHVGQLDAVIPDSLTFIFNAIKAGYRMPSAELHVEVIQVCCSCTDCGSEFGVDLPLFVCPNCGGGKVRVRRGRGITLTRITAEVSERLKAKGE